MKLVVISDTHMWHDALLVPPGDVIIHCGDFGVAGTQEELKDALTWFKRLPHAHKICIAGNHDLEAEKDKTFMSNVLGPSVHYLEGTGVNINGINFWGSPIQPVFRNWAFNRDKLFRCTYWDEQLPTETDVLITHCPPRDMLDKNRMDEHVGCKHLARNIIERVKPDLHVFGHIHEDRGARIAGDTHYVNASMVNLRMHPIHSPWVLDYDKKRDPVIELIKS